MFPAGARGGAGVDGGGRVYEQRGGYRQRQPFGDHGCGDPAVNQPCTLTTQQTSGQTTDLYNSLSAPPL